MKRFDIYLINLDPTIGSEIQKTRPCVIISPNEMSSLKTLIIAPLTSKGFDYLFRIKTKVQNKDALILLDQIRTIDKSRLIKKITTLDEKTSKKVAQTLVEMFSY